MVRASYADDAGFRARFRREIEVARQVDSPWVVPLLGADADAEDPWLATAFVPGPSLSEALEDHGPWSPASVCVLGCASPRRWTPSTGRGWCTAT
ncbi:hypothetical protein QBA75_25980 [Streptomyces stelliscabiei]